MKPLPDRGTLRVMPRGYHFDAYRTKLVLIWRPGDNCNTSQRALIALAETKLGL